jgi:hypothetical protein
MAMLLGEVGDRIGKGILDATADVAGDELNKGILGVAEKIPIIGDGVKVLAKDYNMATDKVSDFVNDLFDKHNIPKEHKEGIMKDYEKTKLHNKLYNDLDYSDDPKLTKNQRVVKPRNVRTPESTLKNELFNSNKDIRPELLNPDGSINLNELTEDSRNVFKNRLESENRHGFDLDAERLSKTKSPKHTGIDHSGFSDIEKNKLIGKTDKPMTTEEFKNVAGDEANDILNKFDDDEELGESAYDYMDFIYDTYRINPEDISSGRLEDLPNAPEVDDIQLKFYDNDNFKSPNQVITNLNDLEETNIEDLQKYNKVATPDQQVKSTESLTYDIIKDKNEIPEITDKLETDGLKVEGIEKLNKNEIKKYGETISKYYNRESFNNSPKRIRDFGLEKTPDELAKVEKRKEFTGAGRTLTDEPDDTDVIDLDGEKTTIFSRLGLDNPPEKFKQLATKIKDAISGMSESTKNKVMDFYNGLTWQQIATMGVSGGLTAYGYAAGQKQADEIRESVQKMPKELRDSLGIDMGIFNTISSLSPTNTSLSGILDTINKLHKLTQQIGPNAQKAKDAINIYNQPSSSIVTDSDNKRKMDIAEKTNEKGLENTKKEAEKIKKQLEIAKIEEDNIKKKDEKEKIETEKQNKINDRKANQDAQRSKDIMGGNVQPTTKRDTPNEATGSRLKEESDKSVNINIINDSNKGLLNSAPESGILKVNHKPPISEKPYFENGNNSKGIIKPIKNPLSASSSGLLKKINKKESGKRIDPSTLRAAT